MEPRTIFNALAIKPDKSSRNYSDIWTLDDKRRTLSRVRDRITLTTTETLILKSFITTQQRILSKDEITFKINKDPESYTGLPVYISRLQNKYKTKNFDAGLFRSARNRGYCLVQEIRLPT